MKTSSSPTSSRLPRKRGEGSPLIGTTSSVQPSGDPSLRVGMTWGVTKTVFFILLLFLLGNVQAKEAFPKNCKPRAVPKEGLVLEAKKPMVVLLHNNSETNLWITQAEESTPLSVGQWSALLVGSKSLELHCIESKPGHEQEVPCLGLVTVCDWLSVTIPKTQAKSLWAAENMSLVDIISFLGTRGYGLSMLDY